MCVLVWKVGAWFNVGVAACAEENKSSHNCTRRLTHLELPLFGLAPQSTLLLRK